MGRGAFAGIDSDLAWNNAASQKRGGEFGELLVVDCDGGDGAAFFGLRNDFGIGRHFFSRVRHGLLDLDPDHLGELFRIGCGQVEALCQDESDREGENDVVIGLEELGRLLETGDSAHFPRAAMLRKAHQVPAIRGGSYVDAFRCGLDVKAPSRILIE